MQITLVRHLWGVDLGSGLGARFAYWRSLGYQGIEAPVFLLPDFQRFREALREQEFFWIPQIFTCRDYSRSVEDHVRTLREQIEPCLEGQPVFFNAQSGCDAWSLQEAEEFFGRAVEIERALGVTVCHETHRSRYLGSPWNTRAILKRVPELKLTCDLSHWVCVAERLLPDCAEELAAAADHCRHIHARVGYEEGPQVPDPRALEWAEHLQAHEGWWDQIWRAQRAKGFERSTLTPEFGPPPYMHTLPFTKQPVADLAEVCDWMALRQRERFLLFTE
jgi:sugar phosphate isomerase/epimerase